MLPRSAIQRLPAILICGFTWATTYAAEEPKATTERDLVYTKAGSTELKLDLALPGQGEGPFPAVLVIHGGAWRGGNKGQVGPVLLDFARRGYVAVSPQY